MGNQDVPGVSSLRPSTACKHAGLGDSPLSSLLLIGAFAGPDFSSSDVDGRVERGTVGWSRLLVSAVGADRLTT